MAGDGTTSVVVICGALLKKAQELLERGVHPTVISDSFNAAVVKAYEVGRLGEIGELAVSAVSHFPVHLQQAQQAGPGIRACLPPEKLHICRFWNLLPSQSTLMTRMP